MSTTIKVNPDYFTKEKTQEFLKDHELACQTMEGEGFAVNTFDKFRKKM